MATRQQIERLGARIEALAAVIDPGAGAVTVAVFAGETPEQALQRHCELRPEHRGRRVKFEWRANERDEIHEAFAVWAGAAEADFQEFKRAFDELCKQNVKQGSRNFVEEAG